MPVRPHPRAIHHHDKGPQRHGARTTPPPPLHCAATPRPLTPPPASQYDKFVEYDFGRCPRVLCEDAPLLPVGRSDLPRKHTVSLYCPRCNDVYQPKSTRHTSAGGVGGGVHPQWYAPP